MAWLERFWFGCGHRCGPEDCPLADADHAGTDGKPRKELRGVQLVLPAVVVFILPLLTAISGAHLAGRWCPGESFGEVGRWQAVGTLIGLLVGAGLAKLLLSVPRRPRPSGNEER